MNKIDREIILSKKAKNAVGDKWNIIFESTEEEKKQFTHGTGQITWGFREQLKCERELKSFFLFK